METLSIESQTAFSLELIKDIISQFWQVETSAGDTLVVHEAVSRAYLHLDLSSNAEGIYRLLLDYSNIELAKSLVEKIADDSNYTVDNDFGTILPGDKFVARLKSEKGWNWRES